jgi:hypothetical protein
MSFGTAAEDIVNRALDSIGYVGVPVGDLQEGSTTASAALRVYQTTRCQLLRAANWGFARRRAQLTLLQDATGQTTLTNARVGTGTPGQYPWTYMYQWPTDGLRARWVPANWYGAGQQVPGNISTPATPLFTAQSTSPLMQRDVPTRFLVTSDIVPALTGAITSWNQYPDFGSVHGQSPAQQTVILSNQQNASLVYTADVLPPDLWDPLFQQAMVATLGSLLAMPVLADKKFALQVRRDQIAMAKAALDMARVSDGDEGWTSTDHQPDFISVRSSGSRWNSWEPGGGGGYLGLGWGSMSFADGSAF